LNGALSVRSAQIPFTIRDGRLRVEATTLDAQGARTVISGGYDIPADQADIRASIAPTSAGFASGHPEIQLFTTGTPDKLNRSIDVSALSSWLAVRTIDRETKRLDAIERGERPPVLPASTPPPALTLPPAASSQEPSTSDAPVPAPAPRHIPPRPRISAPRPPQAVPPLASQQLAPLPPPVEVHPLPGAVHPARPRLPLQLVPSPTTSPQ